MVQLQHSRPAQLWEAGMPLVPSPCALPTLAVCPPLLSPQEALPSFAVSFVWFLGSNPGKEMMNSGETVMTSVRLIN